MKQGLSKRSSSKARRRVNRRRSLPHPPAPELPRQLVSRWGTLRIPSNRERRSGKGVVMATPRLGGWNVGIFTILLPEEGHYC